MQKLKLFIWYICVIACTIFADLSMHYQGKGNEKDPQVLEKQIIDQILRGRLYITGDAFEYTADTVTIDNMQVGENRLMIALIYFNHENKFGIFLTKDEALQEYENFCAGSGNYDKLLTFSLYNYRWNNDGDFKDDLADEIEYLELSDGDFDWSKIEEIDSEQLAEICNNILDYSDIWREANNADYGGCDLGWKLLDVVDEWRCGTDENGNYYFLLDGGEGIAYCDWGTYAPHYEKQLYITKIVYGNNDEEMTIQGNMLFTPRIIFGCYISSYYEENYIKNSQVPDEWVVLDGDEKSPCFRYGHIQVSFELKGKRVKRITISIVEE